MKLAQRGPNRDATEQEWKPKGEGKEGQRGRQTMPSGDATYLRV
jgi:hypothetical protein